MRFRKQVKNRHQEEELQHYRNAVKKFQFLIGVVRWKEALDKISPVEAFRLLNQDRTVYYEMVVKSHPDINTPLMTPPLDQLHTAIKNTEAAIIDRLPETEEIIADFDRHRTATAQRQSRRR